MDFAKVHKYPEAALNSASHFCSDQGSHGLSLSTSNQNMSKDRKPRSFAPVCYYCKKPGHVSLTVGS